MADIDAMAKRTGNTITTAMRGDGAGSGGVMGGKSGAMRESLVLLREISRGNWSRVPGSFSILVSQLNLMKYLLNPITIGLVALGTAAFFAAKHMFKMAEDARNLRDVMDLTKIKFTDQAEAMRRAAEQAQSFNDWLRNIRRSEEDLKTSVDETLKSMRERAKIERESASARGAGKSQLLGMDLAEAKKELEVLKEAEKAATKKMEADTKRARTAENISNNPNRAGEEKNAREHEQQMGKIVDAIQAKMKTLNFFHLGEKDPYTGLRPFVKTRPDDNAKIDVEVDGKGFRMSLNEAKKKFGVLSEHVDRLARAQKEYADLVERMKHLTEKDKAEKENLTQKKKELEGRIANLNNEPEQMHRVLFRGSINSAQRLGAYAPQASTALVDESKKIHKEIQKLRGDVQGLGKGSGRSGKGVQF